VFDEQAFLAMEYVDGEDLALLLACAGLAAVHRDLSRRVGRAE
jgi:hypothetical protein